MIMQFPLRQSFAFLLLFLTCAHLSAQPEIETEITSKQLFELSVLDVYPDSFPDVEVVFLARDADGKPLWDVVKDDITVNENGALCPIKSLTNISDTQPIQVALVMDHSGSMQWPALPDSILDPEYIWTPEAINFAQSLPSAMELAKEGVLSFVDQTDLGQDAISVVGFSSYTDSVVGPTQDAALIKATVEGHVPTSKRINVSWGPRELRVMGLKKIKQHY